MAVLVVAIHVFWVAVVVDGRNKPALGLDPRVQP